MVLISDLWVPDIWIEELQERQATFPVLFNSKVVTQTPKLDEIASGAGETVNIPFLKDITDQDDEIQVENTGPVNDNGQPGSKMVGVPLNRVCKNSSGAMAAQMSGADPMGAIFGQMLMRRQKQNQKTLLAIVRGLMGTGGAANIAAALALMRVGGTKAEPFIENGLAAGADNLFTPDLFIDAKYLMGELANDLANGVFWCHTNIKARLEKLDADGFKTLQMPSELPFTIETYRDVPIVASEWLVRAGANGGYVYDSYLIASGCVAFGQKAQKADVADMASLQYFLDRDKNNEIVWDRNRKILHVNGTKWVGDAAGESPTNAELQDPDNWEMVFQTPNRCGITAVRTNG